MTREARLLSGIILITIPTIQYGGYFLLTSLMSKTSGYMENPLRQNFFRAGHAHAGVIVILSLVCQILADSAVLPSPLVWFVRIGVPLSAISHIGGVLFLDAAAGGHGAERSSRTNLRGRCCSRHLGNHAGCWLNQNFSLHVKNLSGENPGNLASTDSAINSMQSR